jgi:aminopeptidase N
MAVAMKRAPLIVSTLLFLFAESGWAGPKPIAHYRVAVTIAPAGGSLAADVTITIPTAELKREAVFLLGGTYNISSTHASGGAQVTIERIDSPIPGLQRITLQSAGSKSNHVTVRVRYNGLLAPSGDPPLNVISPELVELNLDSFWIPVRMGFTSKFTVDAEIRGVPSDLILVAPGTVRRLGNRVLIRRRTGDVDLAFAAMRGLKCTGSETFEFCAANAPEEVTATYRQHGPAAIAFLERWFGPMPARPARVVMVRRTRSSGYARPGYIVLTEAGATAGPGSAKFIAHEFAHAWWASGDPTTEHRWLSESIAEYVSLRYVEAGFGKESRDELTRKMQRISEKAGPMIGQGPRGDAELYNKGPLLLFRLEELIGRSRMDAMLSRLSKEPPAVTCDFMRALAATAGPEVATKFEAEMRK